MGRRKPGAASAQATVENISGTGSVLSGSESTTEGVVENGETAVWRREWRDRGLPLRRKTGVYQ